MFRVELCADELAALGGLMTGGSVGGVTPDERATAHLVLQGSATSPVTSAGRLAPKSLL